MKKTILTAALCLCMVAALAACNSGDGSTSVTLPATTTPATTSSTLPAATSSESAASSGAESASSSGMSSSSMPDGSGSAAEATVAGTVIDLQEDSITIRTTEGVTYRFNITTGMAGEVMVDEMVTIRYSGELDDTTEEQRAAVVEIERTAAV